MLETYEALNLGSHLWALQFLEPVSIAPSSSEKGKAGSSNAGKHDEQQQQYPHAVSIAQHPLVENTLFR